MPNHKTICLDYGWTPKTCLFKSFGYILVRRYFCHTVTPSSLDSSLFGSTTKIPITDALFP